MKRRTLTLQALLAGAIWCLAGTASALETQEQLQSRLIGETPATTPTEQAPAPTAEIQEAAPATNEAAPATAKPIISGPEETLGDIFAPNANLEQTEAVPFSTLMSEPTAADRADPTTNRWNWVFGFLVIAAGSLMLFNKGKLGTLPGTTSNLRVLERTNLGRDGSVTMLEVHGSDGSVRRVLIGASTGSSPQMLMELETIAAPALDAEQVSQDKQQTLDLLNEMMGERKDQPSTPQLVDVSSFQPVSVDADFDARLDEAVGPTASEGAQNMTTADAPSEPVRVAASQLPTATITRPTETAAPQAPQGKRSASVLPFERVLAATMDEEPDPEAPRPRRGRWEVIA